MSNTPLPPLPPTGGSLFDEIKHQIPTMAFADAPLRRGGELITIPTESSLGVERSPEQIAAEEHALEASRRPQSVRCPCCHSSERVILSPKPEFGRYFCPCNEPGPQYFNADSSGTMVGADLGSSVVRVVPVAARPPYQQRVLDEKADLDKKLAALRDFLPRVPHLDEIRRPNELQLLLLERQLAAMRIYSDILGERIADFAA